MGKIKPFFCEKSFLGLFHWILDIRLSIFFTVYVHENFQRPSSCDHNFLLH